MSDIASVNMSPGFAGDPIASSPDRAPIRPGTDARTPRPSDRVEVSERARLLSKLTAMPPVRSDLVASVRAQIAAGSYEDMDRLEGAIQALAEELGL